MKAPSFVLPACPICSSVHRIDRPSWVLARHTSKKIGKPSYIFSGCIHAGKVADLTVRADPADWDRVEREWSEYVATAFEARTQCWPEDAVRKLQKVLTDKPFIPGACSELPIEEKLSAADEGGSPKDNEG